MLINHRISLSDSWPDCYLDTYVSLLPTGYKRKALLVIPGGGYGTVCSDREGEPIALAFLPYGYNAFVLHYSTTETSANHFPTQLIQAALAIEHIKDHAQEYQIEPKKIFAVGFSAGGHLAGCLATMWDRPEVAEALQRTPEYVRPVGAILIYPVVTGIESCAHFPSFQNLLGEETPSKEDLAFCSLERAVSTKSCPVFLMHTANDELVSVRNSLLLAEAYAEAGIPFELHIYPDAPHGVALGNEITECSEEKWKNPAIAKWVDHAVEWMDQISKNGGDQS